MNCKHCGHELEKQMYFYEEDTFCSPICLITDGQPVIVISPSRIKMKLKSIALNIISVIIMFFLMGLAFLVTFLFLIEFNWRW